MRPGYSFYFVVSLELSAKLHVCMQLLRSCDERTILREQIGCGATFFSLSETFWGSAIIKYVLAKTGEQCHPAIEEGKCCSLACQDLAPLRCDRCRDSQVD